MLRQYLLGQPRASHVLLPLVSFPSLNDQHFDGAKHPELGRLDAITAYSLSGSAYSTGTKSIHRLLGATDDGANLASRDARLG